jgi:predicted regulator of Ras-like GTPase activity (Roadblock/LC7/MglB family)
MLLVILTELIGTSADIEASWVVSAEGVTIAALLPAGLDEDRAGAMCAGTLDFAERTVQHLAIGTLEQVAVKGDKGYVLMANAGKKARLGVLAKSNSDLDTVFSNVERAAEKIRINHTVSVASPIELLTAQKSWQSLNVQVSNLVPCVNWRRNSA